MGGEGGRYPHNTEKIKNFSNLPIAASHYYLLPLLPQGREPSQACPIFADCTSNEQAANYWDRKGDRLLQAE